jgi:hypothetical protein
MSEVSVRMYLDSWNESAIQVAHSIGPELEEREVHPLSLVYELVHPHPLALRLKRPQALQSAFERQLRATEIPTLGMQAANSDLNDPLIQLTHRRALCLPQLFEGFVAHEELAAIEFVDSPKQQRRGR